MTTLFIPLVILLVTHGVLRIPLLESQGSVIILFFIWITSSQAILTLTRLRAVASWKVSAAMLFTLLFVVFNYLFAVTSFTAFLYPNPEEVASYFKAADLPDWLFDLIIITVHTDDDPQLVIPLPARPWPDGVDAGMDRRLTGQAVRAVHESALCG